VTRQEFDLAWMKRYIEELENEIRELKRENSRLFMETVYAENRAAALEKCKVENEGSVVYYIECRKYVKIGVSINVKARIRDISISASPRTMPEEIYRLRRDRRGGYGNLPLSLLATEPGSFQMERARHAQFAHLRAKGEWFRKGDDLMAHIEGLAA
jgi:hypothetical protein